MDDFVSDVVDAAVVVVFVVAAVFAIVDIVVFGVDDFVADVVIVVAVYNKVNVLEGTSKMDLNQAIKQYQTRPVSDRFHDISKPPKNVLGYYI